MHQTPPYPGAAAEGAVPSSLMMDTPLMEERRAAGSPTALSHGESDDAQEMSTNSTEISSSDCYTQLSSESSDGCENRSSVHRRKRRKTSVISSASEQSGEDSPSACESLESNDVQITPGQDYVLPQRCDLSDAEKNRVVALIKEIKAKVTVFVAIMLRSYSSYVTIPKEYAAVHFPHESTTITLRSPGKNKKWHPRLYKKGTMMKLTGSWLHFVRDNDVHEGDICVFVPAKGGKPFTFTVHLLRKETTDSQTEVSHESSECEDSHGQPPYILPYGARLSPSQRSAVQKKVHSIQSEVPIYVSIMTKSNLGSRHMELSKRYAAEHLPHKNVTLMFQFMGKIWNINMLFHDRKYPKRWYLIGGWSKFISDNSLRLGDICLFELKKDKKELTVIVHLLRKESIDHLSGGSPVLDSNYVRASTMIASKVRVGEEPDDEEETSSSGREQQGFDDEPIEHNHSEGASKAHMPTASCSESNVYGISPSSEAREQAARCSNKSFATEFPNKPSSTMEHNRIIHTERAASSEVIGLSDYRIHNSCDSIDSQGGESVAVQQQSSPSPGIDNSINRDSSCSDHRRAEDVEGESDVALQSLVRVTGQQVGDAEKEVNASGDNNLADLPHLEPQNVAAVPSQAALPIPKEKTDTQTNRSAQPDVAQAQPPQGEVEQAGLSGVASPQPSQPEMQASSSREVEAQANVVIQFAQQSVAPAQLAQGETEQDLSGVALPSQPETRLSISGFVENQSNLVTQSVQQSIAPVQFPQEQAGLSGVASAQPLVPDMQPSTPLSTIPLERRHPNLSQSSHQPEAAAGTVQPAQLFPSMMFNHPPIGDEPLKNELHRLRLHIESLDKIYELKQTQLQTECSQEIEKIKQKYDLLIEVRDSVHLEQMKTLDGLFEKVVLHQSLAADFHAKFISSSAAQAKARSPPIHQTPQASQQAPTRPFGVTLTSPPVAWSSAGRPVVPGDAQPSQVDRPSTPVSSQAPRPPLPSPPVVRPPINPGNLVITTGAHMPRVPPRGSHGVPSAPAPHLQRRLPPRAHSTAPANQRQQQHATSVSPQSSHAVPPVSSSPLPPSSSQPTHHGSSTRMDVDVVCLSDDDE